MQKEQQELANLIKGKKVAFIGAGVSHKTLIREFVELGAHVTLCDQKKSVEDFGDYAATIKELGIDLSLGENYLDGFKGQDIIMRTPGFVGYFEKPLQDAMAAGTMVTSEVELFFQFCPCEIVAVTGSDVQRYGDFREKVTGEHPAETDGVQRSGPEALEPQCKGAYEWADLTGILPAECNRAFVEGMDSFDRQIRGFASPGTILTGVESRTSSPVRIERDEELQSAIRRRRSDPAGLAAICFLLTDATG